MAADNDTPTDLQLVTIGITCFDAADTILRAIDCALSQDWPRREIVVVDDGSSDDSASVVAGVARAHPEVRLICHDTNRGYAGALNTIFQEAGGEFVAIFDDDDVSDASRITRQMTRLGEYCEIHGTDRVLCYTNRTVVQNGRPGGVVEAIGRKSPEPNGPSVADFLLWHRRKPGFVWGQFGSCTMLAPRKTIMDAGGFDESFRRSAEWDLAIRLALEGGHFIAVDETLVTQYITRTPDKAGSVPLENALRLREKHRAWLQARGLYRASVAMARARFYYASRKHMRSRFYLAQACLLSPFRVFPSELVNWKQKSPIS